MSPLRPARPLAILAALAALVMAWAGTAGAAELSGGGKAFKRHAERAGGERPSGGGLAFHSSVGDVGVSSFTGGGLRLYSGFVESAAQPGSVASITAVSKSTGTLDLVWAAPGIDGFQGNVAGGFYRIDYSSEPAHVFTPTTYVLEFATNAAPGTTHFLQLTGLQPNTTYYTKIYLADARKFFAEDSDKSDESTLANIPINPSIVAVSSDSVTISWALPAAGAAGFDTRASSTNFGALFPGGAVIASTTHNGLSINLTITGLVPNTTYFFQVASLNWQDDRNPPFVTVLSTLTPISTLPLPPYITAAALNPLARTVQVTWSNAVFSNPTGVLVLLSTSATTNQVSDGLSFTPGQVLADAAVVKSIAFTTSLLDSGLDLDTTYYYHLFSQAAGPLYSVRASTQVFLDLPPMAALGLSADIAPDRTWFTLRWKGVTSNLDGSIFPSSTSPRTVELVHYEIFRATSVLNANWVRITTLPITADNYTDALPDPNQSYIYKAVAVDSFGTSDAAMAMDTDKNLYAFAPDQVTRFKVPPHLVAELSAGGNAHGADMLVRARDLPPEGEKVFRTVRFDTFAGPEAKPVAPFQFSKGDPLVSLRYQIVGGKVVPSGTALAAATEGMPAAEASQGLGVYWNNGAKYIKLFGKVDPALQTIEVNNGYGGEYQIRALTREQGFSFDISQISNKAITPNGDGLNDSAVFIFDNPKDSAISGKIFDLTGAQVADMRPGPAANSLQWDGRGSGRAADSGIYIYQIRAEDKVFNGTLVVIQ